MEEPGVLGSGFRARATRNSYKVFDLTKRKVMLTGFGFT